MQEMVLRGLAAQEQIISILFVLPKDEYCYYTDQQQPKLFADFQHDLTRLIGTNCQSNNVVLNVYFARFNYLDKGCKRPYIKIDTDTILIEPK